MLYLNLPKHESQEPSFDRSLFRHVHVSAGNVEFPRNLTRSRPLVLSKRKYVKHAAAAASGSCPSLQVLVTLSNYPSDLKEGLGGGVLSPTQSLAGTVIVVWLAVYLGRRTP
jgi:hypothetical protein